MSDPRLGDYPPVHSVGTLVCFEKLWERPTIGVIAPGGVYRGGYPFEPDRMEYEIKYAGGPDNIGTKIVRGERRVRAINWREFIWYRNPETGRMNCGKTRGFMAIIIHIAALIVIGCGFTVEGPWKIAPFVIGAGVLAIFWIGTRLNFTGKWV